MLFTIDSRVAHRINQGIADAKRTIDREMKYSAKFRNASLVAECEAHIAKMNAALAAGVLVSMA